MIKRILNNNAIIVIEKNQEVVIMGKGIGFNKKIGDNYDEFLVDKKFYQNELNEENDFAFILKDTKPEVLETVDEVIKYASKRLKVSLNQNIYITLLDHINFAIVRSKENIKFECGLLWEIQEFYSEEYEIGLVALDLIDQSLAIKLDENEAGFIALHIISALESELKIKDTIKVSKILSEVIKIIREDQDIDISEKNIYFRRLVVHLKFFLKRYIKNENITIGNIELFEKFKNEYTKSFECATKIKEFLEEKYKFDIKDNEIIFLMLHLERSKKQRSNDE
ncbi:MAG: PRD domain-containing protein [Mycoplasmatales bacterium]